MQAQEEIRKRREAAERVAAEERAAAEARDKARRAELAAAAEKAKVERERLERERQERQVGAGGRNMRASQHVSQCAPVAVMPPGPFCAPFALMAELVFAGAATVRLRTC